MSSAASTLAWGRVARATVRLPGYSNHHSLALRSLRGTWGQLRFPTSSTRSGPPSVSRQPNLVPLRQERRPDGREREDVQGSVDSHRDTGCNSHVCIGLPWELSGRIRRRGSGQHSATSGTDTHQGGISEPDRNATRLSNTRILHSHGGPVPHREGAALPHFDTHRNPRSNSESRTHRYCDDSAARANTDASLDGGQGDPCR